MLSAMFAISILAPRAASACAMCGLSPGDSAGHAFNTSVLFMLAGPYVTVLTVGALGYLAWRKSQKKNEVKTLERH